MTSQEHTLLLSNIANPAFDYIASGISINARSCRMISRVYSGSLEKLDFGDERRQRVLCHRY